MDDGVVGIFVSHSKVVTLHHTAQFSPTRSVIIMYLLLLLVTTVLQIPCLSLQNSYGLVPAMVVHGVKMVYVPMMPGHGKRLPQTCVKVNLWVIYCCMLP